MEELKINLDPLPALVRKELDDFEQGLWLNKGRAFKVHPDPLADQYKRLLDSLPAADIRRLMEGSWEFSREDHRVMGMGHSCRHTAPNFEKVYVDIKEPNGCYKRVFIHSKHKY